MKPALIIGKNTPMATVKLGNASMLLNQANATSESVGWPRLKQGKIFAPITFSGSCNTDLFER